MSSYSRDDVRHIVITHLDVDDAGIDHAIGAFRDALAGVPAGAVGAAGVAAGGGGV